MRYWVYENRKNARVVIHEESCRFYMQWGGAPVDPRDSRWCGVYRSWDDAAIMAERSQYPRRHCGQPTCQPND